MKNMTKKTTLFISLLLLQQAIMALKVFRTNSSMNIPLKVFIEDVTPDYKEVDSSLFYYEIVVLNPSLENQANLAFETVSTLGYKQADSQAWSNNFWKPFYWYEGIVLSGTALATAIPLLTHYNLGSTTPSNQATITACVGAGLALAGLLAQACRNNKAAKLKSNMTIPKAYFTAHQGPTFATKFDIGLFITHGGLISIEKIDPYKSIVISTEQPLENILIDVTQKNCVYEISLVERKI